jgi:hypothetical protein
MHIGLTIGFPGCLAKLLSQSACCSAQGMIRVWHPVDVVFARSFVRQVAQRPQLFTGVGLAQSAAAQNGTRHTAA